MGFWDELQEKAKQVVKKAGETLEDVKDTTSTELTVLKLKRQISLCESEIQALQNAIGKKVYDLRTVQPESFANPEIQDCCEKITEQLRQIAEVEKEVLRVREEHDARGAAQPPGGPDKPQE